MKKFKKILSFAMALCIITTVIFSSQVTMQASIGSVNIESKSVDLSNSTYVTLQAWYDTKGYYVSSYSATCNGVTLNTTASYKNGDIYRVDYTWDVSGWGVGSYTATANLDIYDRVSTSDPATALRWQAAGLNVQGDYGYWYVDTHDYSSANGTITVTCSHGNGKTTTVSVVAPTCTTDGYTNYKCTACGATWTGGKTPATGAHNYSTSSVTTVPTCTTTGVRTYYCSYNRNHTKTETIAIDSNNHNYIASVTAPTCTNQGYTTHTCSRCSASYVDTYTSELGHAWGEWIETTPATPSTQGVLTRTCSRCNATDTQKIPVLTGLLLAIYYGDEVKDDYNNGNLYTSKEGFADDWAAFTAAYDDADSKKDSTNEEERESAMTALSEQIANMTKYRALNTTALQNAINLTPEYTQEYYDASSYNTWNELRSQAQAFLTQTQDGTKSLLDQAEMDSITNLLTDAFNNLALKKADFTNLNAALELDAVKNVNYLKETSAVQLKALLAQVDFEKTILDQSEVDELASQITAAANALTHDDYTPADYTAVDAAIAKVNSLTQSNYVDFSAVTDAIAAVDRTKLSFEQEDVDAMAAEINDAINALVPVIADYSDLRAAINEAQDVGNPDWYYNYFKVQNIIDSIDWNIDIFHQSEVDAVTAQLRQAVADLQLKGADYSGISAAMERVTALGNLDDFTPESVTRLDTAVNGVVEDYRINRQDDVDAMAQAINDAVDAMVLKLADYSEVNNAVRMAEELDRDMYENLGDLDAIMVSIDWEIDIRHQDDVDAIAANIYAALAALQAVGADYSDVDRAIEQANDTIDNSQYQYTQESLDALQNAIDAVDRTLDITAQETVNGYAQAIRNATANLEFVEADYTEVYAAIERANAVNADDYQNYNELETLIMSVDYTYRADRQSDVDEMAAQINNAIDNLQYKSADYTRVTMALEAYNALVREYYNQSDLDYIDNIVENEVVMGYGKDKQTQVDEMANSLEGALARLENNMLEADLTALHTAIDDAYAKIDFMQKDGHEIIPDMLDELYELIGRADAYEGLYIDSQDLIDELTQSIVDKTNALEYVFEITDETTATLDGEFIYGFYEGVTEQEVISSVSFVGVANTEVIETSNGLGTGSKLVFTDTQGNVLGEYTIVIFGDGDGDGWIDMFDVSIASQLANYGSEGNDNLIKALDLNADGYVDSFDVALLITIANMEAGVSQDGNCIVS